MNLIQFLARRRVALGFVTAIAVLIFSRPTWATWRLGLLVACAGEALRIWAAGHLEKGREVTQSGPYRWTRHPLYAGSTIMALGIVIASRSAIVTVLIALYMTATLAAAIHTEETFLQRTFGATYEQYRARQGEPAQRRFSMARAMRNREYRAVAGLAAGFALLALKAAGSL